MQEHLIQGLDASPYQIRLAASDDLTQLLELERLCQPQSMRIDQDQITTRLSNFPLGQWVLIHDTQVIGVLYTQRISHLDQLKTTAYLDSNSLHSSDGPIARLIALNVDPQFQGRGLADALLEFALDHFESQPDFTGAAAVTRFRNRRAYPDLSPGDYLDLCDETGLVLDPIPRFHQKHGAELMEPIANYRPEDSDNQGYGILIRYDLSQRKHKVRAQRTNLRVNPERIPEIIAGHVKTLLGDEADSYAADQPLLSLGLDSMDLVDLRTALGMSLGIEPDTNVFFSHPTGQALADYFTNNEPVPAQSPIAPFSCDIGNDAVAVIGLACRFPGEARTPEEWFTQLCKGVDAVTSANEARRELFESVSPGCIQNMTSDQGGWLRRVDYFDADFFKISPREAADTDPQHRIAMELSWETFERAGINPRTQRGSNTAVYAAVFSHDYERLQIAGGDDDGLYFATGNAAATLAGRLAYFYDFRGPSIALDTACSGALSAVHLAVRNLRSGESDSALVGAVNLILAPHLTLAFSRAGMLSPHGRCRSFDASADGYVRSEGAAFVLLKPLSAAQRDHNRVLAVIRGSAINQDGAGNGLTAPHGGAQEDLLRTALTDAGLEPADIDVIEAHGSGTALGDPVEMGALAGVFAPDRTRPLLVGSVKSNIGHTEAAAGMAGLIKMVLAMQAETLPGAIHFQVANPHMGFDRLNFKIPTSATPWPRGETPRRAGISSFGFSGANAHVILEEAPAPQHLTARVERHFHPFFIAAPTKSGLDALINRYRDMLKTHPPADPADFCYSVNTGRADFSHRFTAVIDNFDSLAHQLDAWSGSETQAVRRLESGVVFMFGGEGSAFRGMARDLYTAIPVFRDAVDECAGLIASSLDRPLTDIIFEMDSREIHEPGYEHPALFAIQYGLYRFWRSINVKPRALIGYGVGEYTAAHAAGVFSLADALKLVTAGARLIHEQVDVGAAAEIFADHFLVERAVKKQPDLAIAAYLGPEHVVVSGDLPALNDLLDQFTRDGYPTRRQPLNYGFHSPALDGMLSSFSAVADSVVYHKPNIELVSGLTGASARGMVMEADYWRRRLRRPIRFSTGLTQLLTLGLDTFIELGPGSVLTEAGQRGFDRADITWLKVLEQDRPAWADMLDALRHLYVRGADIHWRAFYEGCRYQQIDVPVYPFQRKRFWFNSSGPKGSPRATMFPGNRLHLPGSKEVRFEYEVVPKSTPFLEDHRLMGSRIFPTAGYMAMLIEAARNLVKEGAWSIRDLLFDRSLLLPDNSTTPIQLILQPAVAAETPFQLSAIERGGKDSVVDDHDQNAWQTYAHGILSHDAKRSSSGLIDVSQILPRCGEQLSSRAFYEHLSSTGYHLGKSLRLIHEVSYNQNEALCRFGPNPLAGEPRSGQDYLIHPILLDGLLQLSLIWVGAREGGDTLVLPYHMQNFRLTAAFESGEPLSAYAIRRGGSRGGPGVMTTDLYLFTDSGRVLAEIRGFEFRLTPRKAMHETARDPISDWFYEEIWRPRATRAPLPEDLLTPHEIYSRLTIQPDLGHENQGLPARLEIQTIAYVVRAFRAMGWEFRLAGRFTTDELINYLKVAPKFHRLLARLLEMLVEVGALSLNDDGSWEVARVPAMPAPEGSLSDLANAYPAAETSLSLMGRCGFHLADVLRGRMDPLEILFPGGDTASLASFYRDSPVFMEMNQLLSRSVLTAIERIPEHRGVRILELGAGTGGITAHLLPKLPARRCEYYFTDISPLFLSQARQRYADYPYVLFRELDIEKNPIGQGYAANSFDIILVANVLHVTRDLAAALKNVHRLLAPGGLLVMLEGVAKCRWIDLIFGMTGGWWRFEDTQLRPNHPLLPAEKWAGLLKQTGFPEVETLEPDLPADRVLFPQAIILARGAALPNQAPAPKQNRKLIFADRSGIGANLIQRLTASGTGSVLVEAGPNFSASGDGYSLNPSDPQHFRDLFAALAAETDPITDVIYMWSLDAPQPEELSLDWLDNAFVSGGGGILNLVQALSTAGFSHPPALWLVTRGATPAGDHPDMAGLAQSHIRGLAKVIELEHPELSCRCIDLDPAGSFQPDDIGISQIMTELTAGSRETRIAYRDGKRFVARLSHPFKVSESPKIAPPGSPYKLAVTKKGSPDNLSTETITRQRPEHGEIEIEILAAGLNFSDVLDTLGMLPFERGFMGLECSGVVTAVGEGVRHFHPGDAVLAMAPGSFASHVTVRAELAVHKPKNLDFVQAAAVPVNYLAAWYALHGLAGISPGRRILIHAAAGGTGMAAVRLALRAGAEVIGTASLGKWEILRNMGVHHVMDSRTLDFADEVNTVTGGWGVDVVLNCLSGEFIPKSLSVLRQGGRFVEIGKTGAWTPERVAELRPDVSYMTLDLVQLAVDEPAVVGDMLREIALLFEEEDPTTHSKLLPPLKVYSIKTAVDAYRFMQQAGHIGKIVIDMETTDKAVRPVSFKAGATYLITGGLGGLGFETARRLIERGARELILAGRNAPSPEAAKRIAELEHSGAHVHTHQVDVADETQLKALLERIEKSGKPLRGVFHAAGMLDDGGLLQLDEQRFRKVMAPKMTGAWLLHSLTHGCSLDHFVLYSSSSSLLGNRGQANYAAANAFMDALADYRISRGQPALCINWGPWSKVGAVADIATLSAMAADGLGSMTPEQGLRAMERLLSRGSGSAGVVPIDWPKFLQSQEVHPFYSEFKAQISTPPPRLGSAGGMRRELAEMSDRKQRELLVAFVAEQVAAVLGFEGSHTIDLKTGYFSLGMDSLTAVELRNRLQTALDLALPPNLTFDYPNVEATAAFLHDLCLDPAAKPAGDAEMGSPSDSAVQIGADVI